MTDPLAPLLDLPGVRDAADRARDALAEVHRHKTNRRGWPATAAEAAVRAARASAVIEGSSTAVADDGTAPPLLAGALRVAQALDGDALTGTVGTWRRAPLQALARLHLLAAADLVDDQDQLGRPRAGDDVAQRLSFLADLVTGGTRAPAPVVAAIVHGELVALQPFGTADGIVARAASRLVAVASGLDPHNLGVPEESWAKRLAAYRTGVEGFAAGTERGVGSWVLLCCGSFEAGAAEATTIAKNAQPA
ncbi:oxidoreductase [Rhodococcoides corynebacterioides]|uniref:Oxidoreductase n=1 Tax=Rhodococcoides corynebacterioides TaxID=53972 RepID=A0ABS7P5B3_9NOCA|nr:oxidoreductase [Rhodococcus corynebacterioides]MBY6367623.1 oxidoreductase [Rhodococcus corynebacterioides]MBY6407783.1 oxidoreductase [Rhodococcus corynebacterioides]